MKYIIIVLLFSSFVFIRCHSHDHEHPHEVAAEEAPTVAVTQWTDSMELFMEYETAVVGAEIKFIIHLTTLSDFHPVREGRVTLIFTSADGSVLTIERDELLREGIFTPVNRFENSGEYTFQLSYEGAKAIERFEIGRFVVYESFEHIPPEPEEAAGEEITFLKEQQWKIDFATEQARKREVMASVHAVGSIEPRQASYTDILSPVEGIVSIAHAEQMVKPGQTVKKGETLAVLIPPLAAQNSWAEVYLNYEQAKAEYERSLRLKERNAISQREFEQAQRQYERQKAGLANYFEGEESGIRYGAESSSFSITAPLSGLVSDVALLPGQKAGAGQKLFSIVNPAYVWLRLELFANQAAQLQNVYGVSLTIPGQSAPIHLSENDITLVSRGELVDPQKRTLTVWLEAANSDRRMKIGQMVEAILLAYPAVISTARRTGRTELDEHSMGSHAHEMEVRIDLSDISKQQLLEELRNNLSIVPGTIITIGQPISHRIDHMLSGTRANIAVKIFGPDLYTLRRIADQIEAQMQDIKGLVDLSKDQQTDIPQVRIKANRDNLALFGLTAADIDEMIDSAFLGLPVSQVYEGQNRHDLVVRYEQDFRDNLDAIKNSLIDLPGGSQVPLHMVADINVDKGPNYISRENVQRKMVVQANVAGRDLLSVVDDIKSNVAENIDPPKGYYIEYGGQFESAAEATRMITLLSILSILAIFVALYLEFTSFRLSLLVMVNLPLALIGGVLALFMSEGIITIASMVGFITLFGIAVRNGIIMVSHYLHLIESEGKTVREAVVQGSLERLNPIMMTALTTGLALLPLALAMDKPGSEIQAPMSIAILGGLLSATFLNMIVIPVLFEKWGIRTAS
ncbi:HlyD family efflux transporter periplasmic adaptor subunit [candidate division KSB1 bacterium]|nr:efflux RND transporter permease subunit [candidate division KSB1 bacterium]RQW02413.1 MAG: HlyD family efflux transporter periplasmic adaptor subunit [candidate division KSB1 bacterium]